MHELWRVDVIAGLRSRFELLDAGKTEQGVSGRDQRAILKTASGLLKLLYPDGNVTDAELEEVLVLACEFRQRLRQQLHLIAPGEYDRVQFGVRMLPSGLAVAAALPEAARIHRVPLPATPSLHQAL